MHVGVNTNTLLVAVIVLLAALLVVLVVVARRLREAVSKAAVSATEAVVGSAAENAARRIGAAAEHYAAVEAAMERARRYKNNPQLLNELAGFSNQVVAGVLMTYLDALVEQHRTVNKGLQQQRVLQVDPQSSDKVYEDKQVERLMGIIAGIQGEILKAQSAIAEHRRHMGAQ